LRTEVINKLNSGKSPKVIVAFIGALSEKVLKKEDFKAISHQIKVGDQLDFDFVDELLNHYQFNQTDFVSEPGEFSVRGGIVDVFSFSNEKPFRITFFGNEVESIKTFDIESQLSLDKIDEFQLVSNMNFSVSGTKVSLFELLPEDSFVVSKNLYLSTKRIRIFYEKALEKFETLVKISNIERLTNYSFLNLNFRIN
jgi:transcription-repair coupling factor (superfamily II helicase)